MEKRSILWFKWNDPLAHMVEKKKKDEEENIDGDEEASKDSFLEEEENRYRINDPNRGTVGPSILSPIGIIPMHESNLPGKLFNFWMGHTNFDITYEVQKTIENVEGVETLDIFTRYRFRVSIGKNFHQDDVKRAITERLCPSNEKRITQLPKVEQAKLIMKNKYPYWAIFTMKDGQVEVVGDQEKEQVINKSQRYKNIAKASVYSWE